MDTVGTTFVIIDPALIFIEFIFVLVIVHLISRGAYQNGTDTRFYKQLVGTGALGVALLLVFNLYTFEYIVTYLYQHQVEGFCIVYGCIFLLILLLFLLPSLTYYKGHNNGYRLAQEDEENNRKYY
jgi:hypothetical protein